MKIQKINLKGVDCMIKQIAWNTFKNTGDINTFVELMQVKEIENKMKADVINGNNKDEGNSYSRT